MNKSFMPSTSVFKYKQFEKYFNELSVKHFSVNDLILILLSAQDKPIHGLTVFMKEIFLLYNEHMINIAEDPKFFAHKFGPYSFRARQAINELKIQNIIDVSGSTNNYSYTLTPLGKKISDKIFMKNTKDMQNEISKCRKGWDQLGTRGLLKYVYSKYSHYATKSLIKGKYEEIVWGQKNENRKS